jgi:hypothetical protein
LIDSWSAVDLHLPVNIAHNPNLESIHYELGTKPSSRIAADMFSSNSFNKITTIGFNIRNKSLCDVNEATQLRRLGIILVSQSFAGLSRILVRLVDDWPYATSPERERHMAYALNIIYDAFQFARARGILEVVHLTYQRRQWERDITDDCFSKKMSGVPIAG